MGKAMLVFSLFLPSSLLPLLFILDRFNQEADGDVVSIGIGNDFRPEDKTAAEMKVDAGAVLHLVLTLRGGSSHPSL
jgi:hypothetical protein